MIFERRVVVQQLLTVVFWEVAVRLQRHGRPTSPEQNVDVIKVILKSSVSECVFYF